MTASTPNLPDLPLINLGNAELTATRAAFSGQNAVIGEFARSFAVPNNTPNDAQWGKHDVHRPSR
jgi:hypothetical protein